MACFIAPLAESIVVKAIDATVASGEKEAASAGNVVPLSRKLQWLTRLLWGGSALLLFEHIWHGEIVPWFPFLTAMADPADTAEMLTEIATTGVAMAVLITVVWFVMCKVADAIVKRPVTNTADDAV